MDEFKPVNPGDWFHERIVQWSATLPTGHATTHVFRKTSLHHARSGEDINRQVAADARLSESVLITNYVKETDEQRRHQSNRTFQRMVASLPSEVAARYGHVPSKTSLTEEKIRRAIEARNWELVKKLSTELAERQGD